MAQRRRPGGKSSTRSSNRPAIKGKTTGSIKNIKKQAKSSSMGNLLSVREDDSIVVRFLHEPDDWFSFQQHYMKGYFPCTEGDCPGCDQGDSPSTKFLANVVDRDDDDKQKVLIMAKTVANRMVMRYEKRDTITDRDYEISRQGTGNDTTYDVESLDAEPFKASKYELIDLEDYVVKMWESAFADEDDDDDDEDDEPPRRRAVKSSTKRRSPSKAGKRPVRRRRR